MTKYKKLQIIKHALQYYIQREGAPAEDLPAEKALLAEIEEEVRKIVEKCGIRVKKPLDQLRALSSAYLSANRRRLDSATSLYAFFEEQCIDLRLAVGKDDAERIIAKVKPSANQYQIDAAVVRMDKILQIAQTRIMPTEVLITFIDNHQEDSALDAVYLVGALQNAPVDFAALDSMQGEVLP